MMVEGPSHPRSLVGVGGKDDRLGRPGMSRLGVSFIDQQAVRFGDDPIGTYG